MSFKVDIDEQGVAVVEVSLTITTTSAEYGPMMKKIRDAATEHGVPAAGDYITVVTVPESEEDEDE